jgi:hypothetical protein
MGRFCRHRRNLVPRKSPGPMERRLDPPHSAERSAATQALWERQERNTSQRQAECAAGLPKVLLFLRPPKAVKSHASRRERPRVKLAAQAASRPLAKRQSHGNQFRSKPHQEARKRMAVHRELIADQAKLELRTSRAGDPERQPAALHPEGCQESREDPLQDDPSHPAAQPALPRPRASPLPAAPQKIRLPAAQSLPDRVLPPSRPSSRHTPAHPMRKMKTMSASRRSLSGHLYSWYWSTFTPSSTPIASSVSTATEQ